jgi:AcrR family transcriptional regulator
VAFVWRIVNRGIVNWRTESATGCRKMAEPVAARSIRDVMLAAVVERFIESGVPFSSSQVAREAGVSRQAVHKHLRESVRLGRVTISGAARARRYTKVIPIRQRVEVASAGSLYRLSARLLLMDVMAGEVTLDFTGVVELGEEFLDEVFSRWAPANPSVRLKVAHLPSKLAPLFFGFARRSAA